MSEWIAKPPDKGTATAVAVNGHPLHAMLVAFPIALGFSVLGCDILYWLSADPFFARAALWASGGAFWFGVAAGLVGTVELLAVRGIRLRSAAWSHFVSAMVLISMLGANWGFRAFGTGDVLPWGLFISAISVVFVGVAGWLGGKLVFHHQVGTVQIEEQISEEGDRAL